MLTEDPQSARVRRSRMGLMLCGLAAALCIAAAVPTAEARPSAILFRDVTLFDGHKVEPHRSVLVRGGIIAAVGGPNLDARGAQVVDGRGKTLLPGLIDAHVHLSPAKPEEALKQAARL